MLALLPLCAAAGNRDGRSAAKNVSEIVSQYRHKDGFDVVSLGKVGTSFAKSVVSLCSAGDEDLREISRLVSPLKRFSFVEYEEAEPYLRERFNAAVAKALSSSELLMEIKDDDDVLKVYGNYDDKSGTVRDFVVFSPTDFALVSVFGCIPFDELAGFANKL